MRLRTALVALVASTLFVAMIHADFMYFDIKDEIWLDRTKGMRKTNGIRDFGEDPDYGFQELYGPLTSDGASPVSSGMLPYDLKMENYGKGSPGLVAVGPDYGLGNKENAVLANYLEDGFKIDVLHPSRWKGLEIDVLTLGDSGMVDIFVIDNHGESHHLNGGEQISVKLGKRIGILAMDGEWIDKLIILDRTGREGVQGEFSGFEWRAIPEPSSAMLLVLLAIGFCAKRF